MCQIKFYSLNTYFVLIDSNIDNFYKLEDPKLITRLFIKKYSLVPHFVVTAGIGVKVWPLFRQFGFVIRHLFVLNCRQWTWLCLYFPLALPLMHYRRVDVQKSESPIRIKSVDNQVQTSVASIMLKWYANQTSEIRCYVLFA